ncbi:hypothetical protein SERLA73DRAFT_178433 [Serpula lacrymans var. lacrymans S7.3]|uniref:Uncharacterized protein n=1 Tax=Serpula lacrymans var. lacrymans (strain S7.3) TaxID=936435 RepID=F8PRG8_SERL3|nr:hypothetical protein SERLA73DRAFT_178433 [Serpula lacrymans var. lacrymans S7.3]
MTEFAREETSRRGRSRSKEDHHRRDRDFSTRREKERIGERSTVRDHRRYSRSRSRSPYRSRRRSRTRSRSPRRRRSYSRSRSRGKDVARRKDDDRPKRGRSKSRSRSRSSVDSSDSERKQRKRKKDKHRKRSRSREKKERKKEKKEKKKKKSAAASAQWGKHGIISETDFYNKSQEFRTWLLEERKINPESISKDQERKEFVVFVEDFNTATLPHEKYYHMEAYDRRMASLRSGEFVPPSDDAYDPMADLRAHQSRHKKQSVEHESYLNKEQLQELRRVQHERVEASKMKLLGMDVKQNMGVRMDGTMFDG